MQDQIVMLRGPERVRRRPAVIFGSNDVHGVETALQMLLDTLAQEGMAGHCNQITVTQYSDDSLAIQDNGRGIFFGEEDTLWNSLFCQLFAGPLYQNNGVARSIFDPPSGKDGEYTECLALCAVQYASKYMDVCVIRDGFRQTLHFEKGYPVGGLCRTPSPEPTGTCIRFKPDPEVFSEISLPAQSVTDRLQGLALQIPGMKTICRREMEDGFAEIEFSYPQGIADFLQTQNTIPAYMAKLSAEGQERYNRPHYTADVRVGICFAENSGFVKCYHNLSELTCGGTHMDMAIKEIGKYLCWMLEREISEENLRRHLQLVILTNADITSWVNGAKNSIENILIRDLTQDAIGDDFHYYVKVNREALDNLFRA